MSNGDAGRRATVVVNLPGGGLVPQVQEALGDGEVVVAIDDERARDAEAHGYPILLSNLIAQLEGAAYVARGAVNNAGNVARTKKMIRRALEVQEAGLGFSFVEILTMCPTGWFVETEAAPDYLNATLAPVHAPGVLKDVTS